MPRARALRTSLIPCLLALVPGLFACATKSPMPAPKPSPTPGLAATPLLAGTHQLSFEGRRSGEGYFSRDGDRLIFQSEREADNPFYQIYLLDLGSGETTRISPGRGKTTCAWIHPGGRRALFASTHLDPEAEAKQEAEWKQRESGKERRYAWDYDENYDLFSVDLPATGGPSEAAAAASPEPTPPTPLGPALGYDAEASWSPNGRQIVFASNRHAYEADSGVDRQALEDDPSLFIELYLMDADGRNLRRLTDHHGYDGGPFFSPDGQRIVWRRFSADHATAEIFSMRTDGGDLQRITDLGAMSWAPFYHPSGEYLIFTTNLQGHANFELYIVDSRGEHAPVRVTRTEGFDGLPVFSPDGKQLIWTSNRSQDNRSQLFRADWNDDLARELLDLPATRGPSAAALLALPEETDPAVSREDLRAHVRALSSEITEGRLTGTAGERIATSYVARAFRAIGLEPDGDDESYFQNFGFTAGVSLGDGNRLRAEYDDGEATRVFEVDRDWRPFAFSRSGESEAAPVVYANYGIVAPAADGQRAIDHYAELDVEGSWVLVFRYMPENISAETRQHLHRYASLRYKAMLARDHGALGLIVVSGPNSRVREELVPLRFDVSLAGSSIMALSISDSLASDWLGGGSKNLEALQDAADAGSDRPGFSVPGLRISARVALETERKSGRNVIGRLQMGPEKSQEILVMGAHVDHLGRGESSSSLAREEEKGAIHPGADDNASGVAALLEVAEKLSTDFRQGRFQPRRDIVFAAWSGEELGLLGSSWWTDRVVDPHSEEEEFSDHVIAYLNFDMVGRMRDSLSLFGVGSSNGWEREIERANVRVGMPISPQEESSLPTDATAFFSRGAPILSAFTGSHDDYHTPRDSAEKLDYQGMEEIASLMGEIAFSLASAQQGPDFVPASSAGNHPAPSGIRVYLGTVPDYARSDVAGVALSGVSRGGPAERGGLRGGDIIVGVAGRNIEIIYDYTYALDALKADEVIEIRVLRGDEALRFEVLPISRD